MTLFAGKGSEREYRKDVACPQCMKAGVYDVGSSVSSEGQLDDRGVPAADFEVHYECPHCGHEWSRTA